MYVGLLGSNEFRLAPLVNDQSPRLKFHSLYYRVILGTARLFAADHGRTLFVVKVNVPRSLDNLLGWFGKLSSSGSMFAGCG